MRVLARRRPIEKATNADTAEVNRLLQQIDQLDPQLRRAFLQSARRLTDSVDVDQVKQLLTEGRVDQAINYVNSRLPIGAFQPLAQAIAAGLFDAGQNTAQNIGVADFTFGATNPKTIDFVQNYEGNLIRQLTAQTRSAVMTAIRAGIQAGQNPLDTARDLKDLIGLTDRQAQAVKNYRRALENNDRSALDRELRDRRFDPSVSRAASGDTPLPREKIDTLVSRYNSRMLAYRARTIARTESIRAVNAGNHLSWQQMVADGKLQNDQITRTWYYSHDDKTRPAHVAIPGMNPDGVGLNDYFETPLGPLLYPGDPLGEPENTINCRCTVIYRFKYKAPT